MSRNWQTIVPVQNFWEFPIELPYPFNARTFLRALPEWLLSDNPGETVDELRFPFRKEFAIDGISHCITVDYQADALGSPDPEWRGEKPRSIQDVAVEEARNVFFSFWLVRPTTLSFRKLAHTVNHPPNWIIRSIETYKPFCYHPIHGHEIYKSEDFERVRYLFNALNKLPPKSALHTAMQAAIQGLTEDSWTLRFLVLWLVLESLFGPEDPREITFRLSQRIALFLSKDRTVARELFDQVKTSYAWRSKAVHGLRLEKLTPEKSNELIIQLEGLVRRSIVFILSDQSLVSIFDTTDREDYLDGLAFR